MLTKYSQEMKYVSCIEILKSTAFKVQYPVSIPDISVLTVDGEEAIMPIACTRPPLCKQFRSEADND